MSGVPRIAIAAHYNNLEWAGTQDAVRREQTWYVYDQPQLELAGYQQKHTDGRLTKMYNSHGATYFSYDVHGRVVWAVQEINIAGQVKHLTVDYQYSALTSRVEQILYQKDTPGETFAHRYLYDADNRLLQVLVSRTPDDTGSWTKVAGYEYYLHGPLKNTQLGDYIQKVDYVYNLNGWLKAINNPAGGIMSEDDAGKGFASDVFAQALGYYEGDYTRAGTGLVPDGATTMGVGEDAPPVDPFNTGSNNPSATQSQAQALAGAVNLYSGNISSSITRTAFSQAGVSNGGDVMAQTYRYDLLNRFVGSRAATGESLQAVSGMSGSDYAVTVGYDANSNITDLNRTMAQGQQLDQMTYKYATQVKEGQVFKLNNRLLHINDAVSTPDIATDMEDQGSFSLTNPQSWNYQYDANGRIISNRHDGVALIEYNAYGKVKRVVPTDQSRPTLEYTYDATQQRLSKKVIDADGSTTATYYAYDAMGIPMATYTYQETGQASTLTLNDFMLYGSGRLGSYQVNEPAGGTAPVPLLAANLRFELTDHLGTVRAVVSGQKTGTGKAEIVSLTDYYPYGMDMPGRSFQSEVYRYGYQGSERDPEMSGGAGYTTYFRALDPRIGRWLTPDPKVFPWQSPYVSMDGNPVALIDPWGASTGGGNDVGFASGKGTMANPIVLAEVDIIAPAGAYTNKLFLSGDKNRPELFPAYVPKTDYSSPGWVSALKSVAFLMEVAVPGASYVKELNSIADNGGSISANPNMIENGFRDILEKELDKRYIPVEGKSFTASNLGNVDFKKALSIGKDGAKLSASGVDLANVLAGMIVDDLVSQIEELNVARQIAELLAISDYDEFVDEVRKLNRDFPEMDPIIMIYSSHPIVSGPGETFHHDELIPTISIFHSSRGFAIRSAYNGFVPKYAS